MRVRHLHSISLSLFVCLTLTPLLLDPLSSSPAWSWRRRRLQKKAPTIQQQQTTTIETAMMMIIIVELPLHPHRPRLHICWTDIHQLQRKVPSLRWRNSQDIPSLLPGNNSFPKSLGSCIHFDSQFDRSILFLGFQRPSSSDRLHPLQQEMFH